MSKNQQAIVRRRIVDDIEMGSFAQLVSSGSVLAAMKLVKEGRVYDLGLERFHGMPLPGMHPPLEIMTYRSSRGMINQGDQDWITGKGNSDGFGFTSDLVITCLHTGTHVDTLSHANVGPKHEWHGGFSADRYVGDYGTLKSDASTLAPMLARGVMADVARFMGVDALPRGFGITREVLEKTLKSQDVEVRQGDVVLVRAGYLSQWPDKEKLAEHAGSGLTLDAAKWLASKDVLAVGTDTEAVEQLPSATPNTPHPVHTFLLVEKGIFMVECVDLEALSKDQKHEFLFISLPVKFRGGTAGLTDPVAVV